MTALTLNTDFFVGELAPNNGFKMLLVQTKNTVDATNTLAITLANYGIGPAGLIGVLGFKHTTDNSVMVAEQPTTAVSAGVLTITVPSGTDNDPRYYIILGTSKTNP